jgi:hypothetical protein
MRWAFATAYLRLRAWMLLPGEPVVDNLDGLVLMYEDSGPI